MLAPMATPEASSEGLKVVTVGAMVSDAPITPSEKERNSTLLSLSVPSRFPVLSITSTKPEES